MYLGSRIITLSLMCTINVFLFIKFELYLVVVNLVKKKEALIAIERVAES